MEKTNIAIEINKIVEKLVKDHDYKAGDIIYDGENAFQWVFEYDGRIHEIIYQTK